MLDLPQPSSVHSFIHSEMLMQARSWTLWMQRGANRNDPLTQRIYCLPVETNIIQIVIRLTMKSSLWNNNDKTRTLSKPLQQAGCPFPYLLNAKW